MRVIITVPHAACPDRRALHACDTAAAAAARALEAALSARGHRAVLFLATVPRTVVDMNRAESRGTEWRAGVDAALAADPRPDALLDVHSFPRESFPVDLVIMTLGQPRRWHLALAAAVARGAAASVGRAVGSGANDIMAGAAGAGVPAALLEFCEDIGDGAMRAICDVVAEFLITATFGE